MVILLNLEVTTFSPPNKNTVLSPINGHSKKRTPLISGRIYFPRRNSGQTLIKNFLKSGQAISGPSA